MQGINTLYHGFTATVGKEVIGHYSNRELAVFSLAVSEARAPGKTVRINGIKVPPKEILDALEHYGKPEIEQIREARVAYA